MSDNKLTENAPSFKPIKDPYINGNPVKSKEMFFGRENDFRKIKDWMGSEGGQHVVLLIGGRRSGKTSILYQIREGRLNTVGETVWCDFHELKPKIHSDEDFVREIGKNILKNPKFQNFELAFFNGFTADTAPERLQKLLKNCCELIYPRKLLILCDEFDVIEELFENKMLSKEALSWVRSALDSPVCFIMTSSHEYREEHISAAFGGNAQITTIAEFSEQDAYSLIEKPCPELNFHSEALKKIYRLSGGFPFYIQTICKGLINHVNNNIKRTDIKADDLDEVIDFIVANPPGHIQESWRSLFTSGVNSKTALHVFGALANTIQSPDDYADITAILKVAKEQKFDINEDSFIKEVATVKNARLLESINNKPRFRADIFRYWIAYNYQNGADIDEYIRTAFQAKTPTEAYSQYIKGLLNTPTIDFEQRQQLDVYANNLGLNHAEADDIENQVRKSLNKGVIDWIDEYKNSANYVKNNDTQKNRNLLKKTYIRTGRISKETATDINKRFNFSVLPKKMLYWLIASLLIISGVTTAVIAIPDNDINPQPKQPPAATLTLGTGVADGATSAEAQQGTGVVSVTGETGSSISVTFTNGTNTVTKRVTGNGATPVAVALAADDLTTLTDGTITASASQTDVAGNVQSAAANSTSFTLDTKVAPVKAECTTNSGILGNLRRSNVGVIVAMEEESEPMYYVEENSEEEKGFGYEFTKELVKRLDIKGMRTINEMEPKSNDDDPKYRYENLPSIIHTGKTDMVIAGYIKDPEIPNVVWSDSYLENGLCLIVKEGSAITDYKQLSGKKVGLFKGDEPTKKWVEDNIPNVSIDDTHDEKGWLKNLQNGKWDAIIYDYIFTASEIKDFPNLRIVKLNIKPIEYSIILPCNNDDLLQEVNAKIAEIKDSPFYDNLVKKYLDTDKNNIQLSSLGNCKNCYVIKKGDTLGTIAKSQLGDSKRYMEIFELNKERIANPHLLYISTEIHIPENKI